MFADIFKTIRTSYGGIFLVAGNCIGAAMLALPQKTGFSGFFPSTVAMFIVWAFMLLSSFMLLEVTVHFKKGYNLVSLADKTLGTVGKWFTCLIFLFLFYALMVAYISESGKLIKGQAELSFSYSTSSFSGSVVFTLFTAAFIFLGTRIVDKVNRSLMFALLVSYCLLAFWGAQFVNLELLYFFGSFKAFCLVFPVMMTSFGFHNLVPSIAKYYDYDKERIRKVFLIGGTIPLVVYLFWDAIILGVIPFEKGHEAYTLLSQKTPTQALMAVVGKQQVLQVANLFAFFALATSFVGVALSFVHFLADGLRASSMFKTKGLLVALALLPPLLCSFVWENLFLKSLEYVGGFLAILLFGFLPVLMLNNLGKDLALGSSRLDSFIFSKTTKGFILVLSTLFFLILLGQELGMLVL